MSVYITNVLVLIAIIVIAYIWGSRGLFSAMLHMIAVIAAGAIAFAVWEPASYFLLKTGQGWLVDTSWGLGLAVPFAVSLIVIRVALDKIVPSNVDLDSVTNLLGGLVCGAVSGILATGVILLSVGMMRLPPAAAGYRTVDYDTTGSVVAKNSLWFPVDAITAKFYSLLSQSTFRPMIGEPLAKWHPSLATEGGSLRSNFDEGSSKHTIVPGQFEVLSRYTVGRDKRDADIFGDSFGPARKQRRSQFKFLDGDLANPQNGYLEGFVVHFDSGAKERNGRIIVGATQLWLLVQRDQPPGDTETVHPLAMISQASGDSLAYGRWLFDRQDVFIPSVGGGTGANMAFEFFVPRGYRPIALYVKGVRADVSSMPASVEYADSAERDAAIRNGSIISKTKSVNFNWSQAQQLQMDANRREGAVTLSDNLPRGVGIQKDARRGLQIDDDNHIVNGDEKFTAEETGRTRGVERSLVVNRFAPGDDTAIVQVDVSVGSQLSLVNHPVLATLPQDKPLYLIDSLNRAYEPIGYIYMNSQQVWIRFLPSQPLTSARQLPKGGPSISLPDQKYILIYRVATGVSLKGFAEGDVVAATFKPNPEVKAQR